MRRTILILTAVAALAGCATSGGTSPPHRLGSGAVNNNFSEPVTLSVATVYTQAYPTTSIDLLGDTFETTGASTAVCSAPVLECSNSFNPATDLSSDDTKWITVTMTTAPPSLASGANKFLVQYPFWSCAYSRWAITCSAGSGTLTITHMRKGG